MSYVALDLGTSFIKGAIVDVETGELSHLQRIPFPEPIRGLNPLYCEFDPDQIVTAAAQLITHLTNLAETCEGIVFCTQMSSMILTDDRGNPRSNVLGWRDQRALEPHPSGAGSFYDVLRNRLTGQQRRELGNELPVGAPISFLYWFRERGHLEPGTVPMSLADFVICRLCESSPSTDATNAMAYELLNLTTLAWHQEVMEELGLSKLSWPVLRQQGDIVGHLKLGDRSVSCFTPVGDYQCALVGSLLREDELSLNISTGSQVSRILPAAKFGDYQSRPFFDGRFTGTISHLPAGRSLNVLVALLSEFAEAQGTALQDPWTYIASAAAATESTGLQVDLGFYPGPAAEGGAIRNINERNLNAGALFRAAFENMAENYYQAALRIWPDRSWRRIVFSGGLASKIEPLREIILGRFETEWRPGPVAEDTLFGLMLLARAFSGRAASVEQAASDFRERYGILP